MSGVKYLFNSYAFFLVSIINFADLLEIGKMLTLLNTKY